MPFTDQNVELVLLVLSSLGIIYVFTQYFMFFHDLVVIHLSRLLRSHSFLGTFPFG